MIWYSANNSLEVSDVMSSFSKVIFAAVISRRCFFRFQ